ncbi:MAG TPA: IclR family transcriptional regulator [Acinetobacter ursingii]|uniref:IclR family transcriptional regulator n=1 Tax=Acinetobacter ursingii TaxID=108980 RepID=UPI0006689AA6|nr:IclR family transcriptional regulator [Acinetobacter ursingii]MCH2005207.1 IclR family transcriptional regulator [Acinetobacter ursingii]MCU4380078.1 IclR family transcriptional regulator [Acinetobacter ursingii]MCU4609287.1 IclR family transcriptional regulator [Acinetobacter ursingii]HCO08698.1 IclR family transcriptional regulator [Acinetobacter ursingii]
MTDLNETEQTEKLLVPLRHELLHPIEDMQEEDDRQFITALARGLELLRCFSAKQPHLGNQELSQMTGLPKPTITRLTHTLSRLGYIRQVPNSTKFQLSVGVLAFGYSMLANVSVRSIAQPYMKELADYAGAAVAMSTRDRLNMIYLDVVQGKGNVTMRRQVGTYLPIHLSSMGRACLAAMPEDERDFLLNAIRLKHKEDWIKINRDLDKAFKDYQGFGYCFSMGDWHKDVNSVAVPLLHEQHGLLVFNCGGPSFIMKREKLEEDIAPRLLHMVNNIKTEIG